MAKIAYLDCFSGVSGDMLLGAIVDSGLPLKEIEEVLEGLPLKGYRLEERKVKRGTIDATKVEVKIAEDEEDYRKWKDINTIITDSDLPEPIKEKGLNIFKGLFEAEAKVHGYAYDQVHLHELGAIDCLIDVFGTIMGLYLLGIEKVYSSAVNLGSGTVRTEHGIIPVPAPAVIELLAGKPVYSSGPSFELTTPTGAAILKGVVHEFGPLPSLTITGSGYGAGTRDFEEIPNVLRLIIGEECGKGNEEITVIETNIDDMNPQVYEYLFERLFEVGAIDVYLTQVIMKKGRPGILLTVLCDKFKKYDVADVIFKETTTLGVRLYGSQRMVLEREVRLGSYKGEDVRLKVARHRGQQRSSPEYEDCKRIALKKGIPLIEVMKAVGNRGAGDEQTS